MVGRLSRLRHHLRRPEESRPHLRSHQRHHLGGCPRFDEAGEVIYRKYGKFAGPMYCDIESDCWK